MHICLINCFKLSHANKNLKKVDLDYSLKMHLVSTGLADVVWADAEIGQEDAVHLTEEFAQLIADL